MLKLEIVTPEHRVLDAEVDSVSIMTASGEVGILPNHAPLVSALRPGVLAYTVKGTSDRMVVSGGFVEVSGNKVAVLADSAETAAEIDVEAVRAVRDEAEKALAAIASGSLEESEAVRERLDAANAKLQFYAGK